MKHHYQTESMDRVALDLKFRCRDGYYDGTTKTIQYLQRCTVNHYPTGTRLIFTRDTTMHSCGWWKNPDYERCFHLSLSFVDPETGELDDHNKALAKKWCEVFFLGNCPLIWAEPPFSEEGKVRDIWHYRLFMHSDWCTPLLPRKEVYTRDYTPAGYKSWSDLHGEAMIHQADMGV